MIDCEAPEAGLDRNMGPGRGRLLGFFIFSFLLPLFCASLLYIKWETLKHVWIWLGRIWWSGERVRYHDKWDQVWSQMSDFWDPQEWCPGHRTKWSFSSGGLRMGLVQIQELPATWYLLFSLWIRRQGRLLWKGGCVVTAGLSSLNILHLTWWLKEWENNLSRKIR